MTRGYLLHPDEAQKYVVPLHLCRTKKEYDQIRIVTWKFGEEDPPEGGSQGCFQGAWISKHEKVKGRLLVGGIAINLSLIGSKAELAGVIAHECTHAAVHYLRKIRKWKHIDKMGWHGEDEQFRKQGKPEKIPEERLCYAIGRLNEWAHMALKQHRKDTHATPRDAR